MMSHEIPLATLYLSMLSTPAEPVVSVPSAGSTPAEPVVSVLSFIPKPATAPVVSVPSLVPKPAAVVSVQAAVPTPAAPALVRDRRHKPVCRAIDIVGAYLKETFEKPTKRNRDEACDESDAVCGGPKSSYKSRPTKQSIIDCNVDIDVLLNTAAKMVKIQMAEHSSDLKDMAELRANIKEIRHALAVANEEIRVLKGKLFHYELRGPPPELFDLSAV